MVEKLQNGFKEKPSYQELECEVLHFEKADVITASTDVGEGWPGDTWGQ